MGNDTDCLCSRLKHSHSSVKKEKLIQAWVRTALVDTKEEG